MTVTVGVQQTDGRSGSRGDEWASVSMGVTYSFGKETDANIILQQFTRNKVDIPFFKYLDLCTFIVSQWLPSSSGPFALELKAAGQMPPFLPW